MDYLTPSKQPVRGGETTGIQWTAARNTATWRTGWPASQGGGAIMLIGATLALAAAERLGLLA